MAAGGLTREPNQPRHPTDSGDIDTTQRHHFRPPRAAVFNRRQQPRLQPHTLVPLVNPVPEPSYPLVQEIQPGHPDTPRLTSAARRYWLRRATLKSHC
jgi:hypothetical protein